LLAQTLDVSRAPVFRQAGSSARGAAQYSRLADDARLAVRHTLKECSRDVEETYRRRNSRTVAVLDGGGCIGCPSSRLDIMTV
jgi:lipocalin